MDFSIYFAVAFLNLMGSALFYINDDKRFSRFLLLTGIWFLLVAFLEGYGVI